MAAVFPAKTTIQSHLFQARLLAGRRLYCSNSPAIPPLPIISITPSSSYATAAAYKPNPLFSHSLFIPLLILFNAYKSSNNTLFISFIYFTTFFFSFLYLFLFRYLDDDDGIKKFFAAFHLFDKFPAAVVIDDFADFFNERSCNERYGNPRGRDIAMVRVLSLCHNAVMHANEKSHCKLLLSDTHYGDSPRLLFIYKRWVSSIFTIKGDGKGSFVLSRKHDAGSENSERTKTAKYSIALQYLVFEGIIEDDKNKL